MTAILASCGDRPAGSSSEETTTATGSATRAPDPDFKDLECGTDKAQEGYLGEIVPSAKGAASPEAALDVYFEAKKLTLSSKDFVVTAEVPGAVLEAHFQDEYIKALVSVVQVESGGWIVAEFSSCQDFLEDHAA